MTETTTTTATKKVAAAKKTITRKPFSLDGVLTKTSSRSIKAPDRLANQAPVAKVTRKKAAPKAATATKKKVVEKKKAVAKKRAPASKKSAPKKK